MSVLDFDAFFQAVYGNPPLPWQSRLTRSLTETDTWPDLIDLPTASGKTACLDIAVFHLAWCAEREEPWRASRRIVFVVDRRLIVDAAADRAQKLKAALERNDHPAVHPVVAALSKAGGETPLSCHRLRGGMPRERNFAWHPAQPMIITSTVDQIGSRLLFRGYGQSLYAQPLHAGLLGHDTLILLDEAHLAKPFIDTVRAIRREQARAQLPLLQIRPVRMVTLSATAQNGGTAFRLDQADVQSPLLNARRTAPKPAMLVQSASKRGERIKTIVDQVQTIRQQLPASAAAIAVMVNRVSTARSVFDSLKKLGAGQYDVELMIGRSRPLDRDAVGARVLGRAAAGRSAAATDRDLVVVATQTLEVGADLDFQGLVTECASLDALRQRFGRLDRLGTFRQARATIIGDRDDAADSDPVYGEALGNTWRWLGSVAQLIDEIPRVDFSIASMEHLMSSEALRGLTPPEKPRLLLTPLHTDLLCQTSPRPQYDPSIAALLHGLDSAPADVQVVWRDYLPLLRSADGGKNIDDGESDLVNRMLDLLTPSSLETLNLPIHTVQAWLSGAASQNDDSDVEGANSFKDEPIRAERSPLQVWRQNNLDRWEAVLPHKLVSGDAIVVPTEYGGCDEYGFAPTCTRSVADHCARARDSMQRERIELMTSARLQRLAMVDVWEELNEAWKDEDVSATELLNILVERMNAAALIEPPIPQLRTADVLEKQDGSLYALVVRSGPVRQEDLSDDDLSSSQTVPVALDRHNAGVGAIARTMAKRVGLPTTHVDNIGRAGDTHDLGKADPRFQRLLRAGDDLSLQGELLAKGLRGKASFRVELGERHEAYSVALLRTYPQLLAGVSDPDLALYLVGSHHGRGRALMPMCPDEGVHFTLPFEQSVLEFDGVPELAGLGSGWPSLFWRLVRRYGPWGLAYLESIVRLADHMQSRQELEPAGQ